jgi:hypothetical protein
VWLAVNTAFRRSVSVAVETVALTLSSTSDGSTLAVAVGDEQPAWIWKNPGHITLSISA